MQNFFKNHNGTSAQSSQKKFQDHNDGEIQNFSKIFKIGIIISFFLNHDGAIYDARNLSKIMKDAI